MSETFETLSEAEQQRLLDRLVDGEIAHDEQRQLILSLEAQPDGWRRCAMAFLEAQAWGREFQQLTSEHAPAASPQQAIAARQADRAAACSKTGWLKPLAVAAGLMLAFTLGAMVRGTRGPAAIDMASSPKDANASNTDLQSGTFETLKVSLPAEDGESEQALEVPLIEADQKSLASLLDDERPVLSEVERKTLESTGHLIEQRRAYYPVQLQDGRQGVVPMDFVEVKYTGGWQ
jgi:hypothetical protein